MALSAGPNITRPILEYSACTIVHIDNDYHTLQQLITHLALYKLWNPRESTQYIELLFILITMLHRCTSLNYRKNRLSYSTSCSALLTITTAIMLATITDGISTLRGAYTLCASIYWTESAYRGLGELMFTTAKLMSQLYFVTIRYHACLA